MGNNPRWQWLLQLALDVMLDRQPATGEHGLVAAETAATADDVLSLVRQHYTALYRYAFRLSGGNAADADDLTQQAFLQALTHLGQVRERQLVASWLYSILRRCFLRQVRREKRQVELIDFDLEQLAEKSVDAPFDDTHLQMALAELPDEFRLVVLMFYFEELSYKQIAAELAMPVGTVMSRLSRAKGHLRAKLLAAESKQFGGAAERGVSDKQSAPLKLPTARKRQISTK